MPKLNEKQFEKRGEILKKMVLGIKERKPWLTLKQAADELEQNLNSDPRYLQILNGMAAALVSDKVAV